MFSLTVSSVGIVTGCIAGFRFTVGARYFSLLHSAQTGSGAHPASCPMDTGGSFPGGKAVSGRETDHSFPSSAEVKKAGAIPPLPHTSSRCGAELIMHRGNFTLPYWFM
jgi:hypothetical protein